jgi:hypothetical protein
VVVLIAAALQRVVAPCVNVTLPVGCTAVPEDGATVAEKVTVWFTDADGSEDANVMDTPPLVTISVTVAPEEAVKLGSPA